MPQQDEGLCRSRRMKECFHGGRGRYNRQLTENEGIMLMIYHEL